jgi:hypothetical protein
MVTPPSARFGTLPTNEAASAKGGPDNDDEQNPLDGNREGSHAPPH